MNIMILVNKDFEYAGYREGVEHRITSLKTPHLHITGRKSGTIYHFDEPSCEYDLVTDTGTHKIREFCISYLFENGENSSNSEKKYEHLKKLIATEKPDYIISVSTSESTSEMQGNGSINGCVVMGSKFYAKDCKDDDDPKETSKLPIKTNYYETINPLFYDFFILINANQQVLTDGMMPAKYYPTKKFSCITNPNYVSLGVVNITNYARYKIADPKTYEEFINFKKSDEKHKNLISEGLETTHFVVKMAALEKGNIPVLFVSPIVDRYERFDDDVDGKWGEQNRISSFNAGVAVANMLEYFRNELGVYTNKVKEVRLSAIKAGMYVHIDATKQSLGDYHIKIVDENGKVYYDDKVKGEKNVKLKHAFCYSFTAESDDLRLILCEFDSDVAKEYKLFKTFSELRDDNNEVKSVVWSIQIEGSADEDYNDLSIQITAWTKKG